MIKVSILIAAYNVEDYIANCLQSCIEQTYENIEILVVNDGSTDGTLAICNEYVIKDSRIKVYSKENAGLISARIAGFTNASGGYFFFLDGDDTIPVSAIEALVSSANTCCDIVVANYNMVKITGEIVKRQMVIKGNTGQDLLVAMFENSLCNIVGNLYSRNLFNNITYPDLNNSIGEDLVLNTQLAFSCKNQVFHVDSVTYNYLKRDTSIIGQANNNMWALGFNAYYFTYRFLLQNNYFTNDIKCAFIKLSATFIIGYIVSTFPFQKNRKKLKESIKYVNGCVDLFPNEISKLQRIILLLAGYNLFLARFLSLIYKKMRK